MSKIMTDFDPRKHGFHFPNRFKNVVFDYWFGSWTTKGRCGGMAFAALDYYYAKAPIPTHCGSDFPGGEVPPDNTRLADYISDRLFDSFEQNGGKFIKWTLKRDHDTDFWGDGVTKLTKEEEFPKLMQRLATGPVALGLVGAENMGEIGDKNHQVVAYGAELDEASGTMTVYIYDNNAPDQTVTLTSNPYDPHFTSSLVDTNNNLNLWYRGWFVEDYSAKQPSYIDLAVVQGMSLSNPYPKVGDPLDCTYTLKNFGDFPSNIQALNVDVAVPAGDTPGAKFAPDTTSTSLNPQQEHVFSKHCEYFAGIKGQYTLRITCTLTTGVKIDPLTAFVVPIPGNFVTLFFPTKEVHVDVQSFSSRIVASPPCVERVEVISITDGANNALTPCEEPRGKYSAFWRYCVGDPTRELEVSSEPIVPVPNKTLAFNVRFSTYGAMRKETVKLTLTGRASDGSQVNVSVPLTGSKDFFTGTWKPQQKGNANYKLTLSIEGADDVPRIPGRTPRGDVLDRSPRTVAYVDTASAGYPFKNYEPGPDSNYTIELAPKQMTMAPDALEANDTFSAAFKVPLIGATVTPPYIYEGAWKSFENLNFHSVTDQDFFSIQYESVPDDDICPYAEPTKEYAQGGGLLGFLISVTHYPPWLGISVSAGGSCTDIDLYKVSAAGPQLYESRVKECTFSLFNPNKVFPNKTLYAVIKNSNFTSQGAFTYKAVFGYVPAHDVAEFKAPTASDIRRKLLKRYYEVIDLPRPPDDLLKRAFDRSFPYPGNSIIITDWRKFFTKMQAFLTHADTIADLKAISPAQFQENIASALRDLGKIAHAKKLKAEVESLYLASATAFANAKMPTSQIEVLKMLTSYYDANKERTKSAKVKELIEKIKIR